MQHLAAAVLKGLGVEPRVDGVEELLDALEELPPVPRPPASLRGQLVRLQAGNHHHQQGAATLNGCLAVYCLIVSMYLLCLPLSLSMSV